MLSYVTILAALATTSVLAAPMGMGEPHMLLQRAGAGQLCGTAVRSLVSNESCKPKPNVYIQKDETKADITTVNIDKLPKGKSAQCDHVIELQMLDTVTKNSKFCDVVAAMVAYPAAGTKATIVQEVAQHVSDLDNLNYLESKVNGKKGDAVTAVLKGSKPANDVVTEAAFNYLDTLAVQTPAKGIATKIDAEIATIVGDAHTLLGKQTKPTNPKSRNANDVKYFTLQKALDAYDKSVTVAAEFQKLLEADPKP